MTHRFACRVYYEDTDLAGIVYYANYLKFIERGRTEMLRAAGISQSRLKDETGLVFAVVHVAIDYRAPARLDDLLRVETAVTALGGASLTMRQRVRRDGAVLVEATVRLACVGPDGRACRLPGALRAALAV
jgi:acyl-CoA thioester hydrolase